MYIFGLLFCSTSLNTNSPVVSLVSNNSGIGSIEGNLDNGHTIYIYIFVTTSMQFEGHEMLALLYHGVIKSRHVHNKLSDLKRKGYTEGSPIRMSPSPLPANKKGSIHGKRSV